MLAITLHVAVRVRWSSSPFGCNILRVSVLCRKEPSDGALAPLTVLGVPHALQRIQDMSEADGLFVESLMIALTQTGQEAVARVDDFVE